MLMLLDIAIFGGVIVCSCHTWGGRLGGGDSMREECAAGGVLFKDGEVLLIKNPSDVWTFPMRRARKASLYRREATEGAVEAL